ncbi:Riboflavin transporter [Pelagimonas phthalicica]|uniref:Riboflavin transporter n=1 Tax=Pelagimonas phthalicica TaxID=1037362 RepID=A0A238JAQ6_9RHOB|nr:DMT family transporter [Pelagimonas phthalicica]TDS93686.1 threonine/homoserine efflux transporter RhtA [Pelagimonas phthalicica]SMX27791.1 Riboflavin transporter [Pelagimonas phthalicica]
MTTSTSTDQFDRPLLGISLMLGFCLLIPFGDALAKLLGPYLSVVQLLTLRFAIQGLILLPIVALTGRPWRASGKTLALIILRTFMLILGIGLMFTSLLYLPLADAVAIAFVMPFIMLLLGHWFLKEEVGLRRLNACLVGFIGTLLIIQPAFAEVGWAALLPLGVALDFALFMLVTRQISATTDPIGMQALSVPIALLVLIPLHFLPLDLPALDWVWPSLDIWGLVLIMGCVGTVGHLLMTWSLRYAPTSTLAPMQYLEIPAATLVGWMIFGDLPGPLASLGIAITIAAGLYIILRERAMLKARSATRPEPDQAPPAAE